MRIVAELEKLRKDFERSHRVRVKPNVFLFRLLGCFLLRIADRLKPNLGDSPLVSFDPLEFPLRQCGAPHLAFLQVRHWPAGFAEALEVALPGFGPFTLNDRTLGKNPVL